MQFPTTTTFITSIFFSLLTAQLVSSAPAPNPKHQQMTSEPPRVNVKHSKPHVDNMPFVPEQSTDHFPAHMGEIAPTKETIQVDRSGSMMKMPSACRLPEPTAMPSCVTPETVDIKSCGAWERHVVSHCMGYECLPDSHEACVAGMETRIRAVSADALARCYAWKVSALCAGTGGPSDSAVEAVPMHVEGGAMRG